MNSKSVNQAMQAYRLAFTTLTNLQTKHDALVEEQRGLLTAITQAQADAINAREVLLDVRIKEFKEFQDCHLLAED